MDETRPSDVSLPMPVELDGPATERIAYEDVVTRAADAGEYARQQNEAIDRATQLGERTYLRHEDGAGRTAWPVSAPPGSDMAKAVNGGDRGRVESEQQRRYAPEVEESGVHALPEPAALSGQRMPCDGCNGTGYMIVSTRDLLKESLALVGDGGDTVVKEFYARLLGAAPDLAGLFPPDLLTVDTIRGQRDKLLQALVALADSYDPDDDESMTRLDTALRAYGRSHAAFARPDGTVRGATLDEYAAVKTVLFGTLVDAAGPAWIPAYTTAWSEAYDFAAVTMMHEQHRSGFYHPRQARQGA